ncbi:hypothetical protein ACH347_02340 [Saccharopolyspora sp. 5N102]|uniref:hypothetical protein n=1 Tax=Saccharopolyspora sp. 5N102 TaxID=3375155 RepID=UPI0037B4B5CE
MSENHDHEQSGRTQGIGTDVPDLFKALLERAAVGGRGASVIETITKGERNA